MAVSEQFWMTISEIVGWLYFAAWSVSFYPQMLVNYKSKSVAGYSLAYATMNPSGYFDYSFYSIGGAIDPYLGTGSVLYNDLLFTLHGLMASSVLLVQIFIYDRGD